MPNLCFICKKRPCVKLPRGESSLCNAPICSEEMEKAVVSGAYEAERRGIADEGFGLSVARALAAGRN